MSADLQCPYCGGGIDIDHDDGFGYEENVRHEMECTWCEKNFVFTTTICFYYEPAQADCLNDGEHDLVLSQTWPKEFAKLECKNCDYSEKQKEAKL